MLVFVAVVVVAPVPVVVAKGAEVELVVVVGDDDLPVLALRIEMLRWKGVCFLSGQNISEKGREKRRRVSQEPCSSFIHSSYYYHF